MNNNTDSISDFYGHICGECAWRLVGPYEAHDATTKKCIMEPTEPACPAFVHAKKQN